MARIREFPIIQGAAGNGTVGRPAAWLVAITVVYVALFAYYLHRTVIVQPYWDMYSHVLRYLQFREDGALLAYLWEPHVQHRHVWMRLLTAFDIEVFGGVAYPIIAASAACLVGAAWLLWRETQAIAPPGLRRATGAFVVMLVLTTVGAVDSATPINAIYPQALFFLVLALVLFDGDKEATGRRRIHARRATALLAACGAAFANAAALAVWPILIWMAWRVRAGRVWMTALVAAAVAFIALYLYGLPLDPPRSAGASEAAGGSIPRLLRMADYLVAYLGLPWTRAAALSSVGRLVGVALLAAGAWAVLRHAPMRPLDGRMNRIAVALVLFSLMSALLAAVGRVDVDPEVRVPVRYSVFLTPLHVGLLWLACPFLERQWSIPGRRAAVQPLMIAAGLVLLAQQAASGQAAVATTDAMRDTIERFIAGETEPGMATVVFDDLEQARRSWERISAAGLYTHR